MGAIAGKMWRVAGGAANPRMRSESTAADACIHAPSPTKAHGFTYNTCPHQQILDSLRAVPQDHPSCASSFKDFRKTWVEDPVQAASQPVARTEAERSPLAETSRGVSFGCSALGLRGSVTHHLLVRQTVDPEVALASLVFAHAIDLRTLRQERSQQACRIG